MQVLCGEKDAKNNSLQASVAAIEFGLGAIMTENFATIQVSDADLARFAKEWLEENGIAPVYLSKLGQQISQHFRTPVREILGVRKLSSVLESQLGNIIEFGGDTFARTIRIVQGSDVTVAPASDPKFDSQFWAAFSKPIPEGRVRFIRTSFPFRFDDVPIGSACPDDRVEVLGSDIPDTLLDRLERNLAVKAGIAAWCIRHGLEAAPFSLPRASRITKQVRPIREINSNDAGETPKGVFALTAFIDAVPPDERAYFSLPLNLIARLLNQR